MKLYSIVEFKANTSKILNESHETKDSSVITKSGKPYALVIQITEADLQWSLRKDVKSRLTRALQDREGGTRISLKELADG